MAALTGQNIKESYEQVLHVDRDGGGNGATLVNVKDGDNGTTFALQLSTTVVGVVDPTLGAIYFKHSASGTSYLQMRASDGTTVYFWIKAEKVGPDTVYSFAVHTSPPP